MRTTMIAVLGLLLLPAGCASPPPSTPFKPKVDGWVEQGELRVAVADERPLAPGAKTYDTGPLGIPAPFGLTPERVVDEYVKLDEKYKITEWLLPSEMAASVKKMLPTARNDLPVGVERRPVGAAVRAEADGRSFEVQTDATGHARLPLAEIAIATLERGDDRTTVSLDAGGAHSEVALSRNDLLGIADGANRLPDYGLSEYPKGNVFWSVVAARASAKLLHDEAARRTTLQLDDVTARLLVQGGGVADLPDGAHVDWALPSPLDGTLAPNARVEISLEPGDGDSLAFTVRVVNEGEGAFHQLRARTHSNVAAAEDVVLLLGRIEPGRSVERRFEVASPRALRNRDVTLEVDFHDGLGQAPSRATARFRAAWRQTSAVSSAASPSRNAR